MNLHQCSGPLSSLCSRDMKMTLAGVRVGDRAGCCSVLHAPSTGGTMGCFAPPVTFQHLMFPCSTSQRDALPMAHWGSIQRGAGQARTCLLLHCIPSHLLYCNKNSQHSQTCPAPAPGVTQTGPAAREQGVKGHTNIWREAQPIPHPCRGAPRRQAALGGQRCPQGLCPQPSDGQGKGVLAASLRHSWSKESQQQCTAGSLTACTSGAAPAGPGSRPQREALHVAALLGGTPGL